MEPNLLLFHLGMEIPGPASSPEHSLIAQGDVKSCGVLGLLWIGTVPSKSCLFVYFGNEKDGDFLLTTGACCSSSSSADKAVVS